jgi:hypothetical protein
MKTKSKKPRVEEPKVYDARTLPRYTPSRLGDVFLERLVCQAQDRVNREGAIKKAFIDRFDDNPAYALSWSQEMFKDAGRLKIAKDILAWVQSANDHQVDEYTLVNSLRLVKVIRDSLMREIIRGSMYPPGSSHATSNVMESFELAARAEVLHDMQNWFEFYESCLT